LTNAALTSIGVPTLANPSFDTNTTGWLGDTYDVLSRTTTAGQYDSAPGGLLTTSTTTMQYANVDATYSGTFRKGLTYRISFWVKAGVTGFQSLHIALGLAYPTYLAVKVKGSMAAGAAANVTAAFTPTVDLVNPRLTIQARRAATTIGAMMYVDSFNTQQVIATIPDRRGFARTKQLAVNSTLPSDGVAAAAIGDAWLAAHSTTPFRGQATLTGPGAIRDRQSGQPVPLAQLLTNTGELIHFTDRKDPDTGTVGRNGRIAAVTYRPLTDEAVLTLDNTRSDMETFLSRLAVVQGSN
jgi:hypothetical protein